MEILGEEGLTTILVQLSQVLEGRCDAFGFSNHIQKSHQGVVEKGWVGVKVHRDFVTAYCHPIGGCNLVANSEVPFGHATKVQTICKFRTHTRVSKVGQEKVE
jgi:hypothetical protein